MRNNISAILECPDFWDICDIILAEKSIGRPVVERYGMTVSVEEVKEYIERNKINVKQ